MDTVIIVGIICLTITICLFLLLNHRLQMAKMWTKPAAPGVDLTQFNFTKAPAEPERNDSELLAVIPPPPPSERHPWADAPTMVLNNRQSQDFIEALTSTGHNSWSPTCVEHIPGEPQHAEATCFICDPEPAVPTTGSPLRSVQS